MLHQAAQEGDIQRVEEELRKRPNDVNLLDLYNQTPLHYAAGAGHARAAKVLLEHGAEVNPRMQGGYSPLHLASYNGYEEVTNILLQAKADTAAQDQDGFTPLHDASRKGHLRVVQMLLLAGADLEIKSTAGWRPADLAQNLEIRSIMKTRRMMRNHEEKQESSEFSSNLMKEEFPRGGDNKASTTQKPQLNSPQKGLIAKALGKMGVGRGSTPQKTAGGDEESMPCLRISSFTTEPTAQCGMDPGSNQIAAGNSDHCPEPSAPPAYKMFGDSDGKHRPKSKLGTAAAMVAPNPSSYNSSFTSAASDDAHQIQTLDGCLFQCQEYSFEDIERATSGFSMENKCGEGGYGSVYKGQLKCTPVAIKVLDSAAGAQGMQEFHQELLVLSRIRHPHIVQLLGVCREHGCLVYEMMDYGSLADHLDGKSGKKPVSWKDRLRIARDISCAVHFLHKAQPHPILHRDIKPGNILLDQTLSVKLGDAGLSKLAPELSMQSTVQASTPVGTYAYIDPECAVDGVMGPFTDVYALGITFLQLVTGLGNPVGIRKIVGDVMDSNESNQAEFEGLDSIIDSKLKKEETVGVREFCQLALQCCSMSRKLRPDLESQVIPKLSKLLSAAQGPSISLKKSPSIKGGNMIPYRFICPITKGILEDPVVASDGFTYESAAIKRWMTKSSSSPMTRQRLQYRQLYPNLLLRSELSDWKAQNPKYQEWE